MTIRDELVTAALDNIIPQILCFRERNSQQGSVRNKKPFVLGLTGLQGSGKSTWTKEIHRSLTDRHGFKVISLSLDDIYLDHENLDRLREENPDNKLLKSRGQPGSHDENLAKSFFQSLTQGQGDILVPSFDKSKFGGEGDRVLKNEWTRVKRDPPVDILIFEGWCVGFQQVSDAVLKMKWQAAIRERTNTAVPPSNFPVSCLAEHSLESLRTINQNLSRYCEMFMGPQFIDYLVHLDTDDLQNVYEWRIQQEHALWQIKGAGMTDEEVIAFITVYMPSYELYCEGLRHGFFVEESASWKRQLRVLLSKERDVVRMGEI